jgi:hypothetical protein
MGWRSGKPVWFEEKGVGVFLAASWSCSKSVFSARPLAADARRWVAKCGSNVVVLFGESVMPNGGIHPSCFVCKWAKKDEPKLVHPVKNNPLIEPIECQQHGFAVWLPSSHVCADLGDPYEESGLSTFAESAKLEKENVYAWLEFGYRSKEHPQIPQYHHELVQLASFQDFAAWTLEQKQHAYHQARNKKEQELLWQSNSDES